MRIALVSDCYWPRVNGVTVSLQSFRDEFVSRGHDVRIYCPAYPESFGLSPVDPGVERLPSLPTLASKEDRLLRLDAFPAFFKSLDEFKPDVIHVNTEFAMQVATRIYSRLRGYPLLISSHTDFEDYAYNYIPYIDRGILRAFVRFFMRRVLNTADVLITPTREMERKLRSYKIDKPFHIIPTGVPLIFSPQARIDIASYRSELDHRFPQLAGKRLLIFAGRVTEEKNVKFLLPVLERLNAARGDVALIVAGDGPYRRRLQEDAVRSGLSDRIAFMGYVPRTDLPLAYTAADIFVFPSKTETQGLCTIEAMATGTPVVAIGEMGTKDVMEGDHGGFMVRDDLAEFSEAVLRLLGDEELRRAKSEEAIAWSRRYRIDFVTDSLLELYETVAAARKPRELRAWIESKRRSWAPSDPED